MTETSVLLQTDTFSCTLMIKRDAKIRRMRLRIDRRRNVPVLVLNKRMSEKTGLAFAQTNAGWIKAQLERLPEKRCFSDKATVTLFGTSVIIHNAPDAKRGVWLENDVLWVSGHPEHLHRRVVDFIKSEMKKRAKERFAFFAPLLQTHIGKITIRDTKSRWGSCNRTGDISLSWRLALAPEKITDYVIVHELCHTREMNHSAHFWKLVADILPDYAEREKWLRKNADILYSYSC